MRVKRSEVLGLESILNSMMEMPLDPEVAYKVASNVILASEEVEKIRKSYRTVEGYDEVEKLRTETIQKLGGERQPNGSFTLPAEKAEEIRAAIDNINEANKETIEKQNDYQEKFNVLLDETINVDFEVINREELTAKIEPGKLVLMIKTGILRNGCK